MNSRSNFLTSLIVIFMVFFTIVLCEATFLHNKIPDSGVVIERLYSARSTSVGVINNGKTITPVTSTTPEKWIVLVQSNDDVFSVDAHPLLWSSLQAGDVVYFATIQGKVTGAIFGRKVYGKQIPLEVPE